MLLHTPVLSIFLALKLSLVFCHSITFPKSSDQEETFESSHRIPENITVKEISRSVANIGLRTLRDLLTTHNNVIISPLNVYSCLEILRLGAAGETKEELKSVLGPKHQDKTILDYLKQRDGVSYASALFLDNDFIPKPEFIESATKGYSASIINVNVTDGEEATKSVNSWVYNKTDGTITDFIQGPIDPDTRMLVVSALVFKGKWLQSFSPAATTSGKFIVDEGEPVNVELMHILATVPVVRNPHLDAIGLPYQDQGMMMYLILPKAPGLVSLKKLLSHLNVNSLKKLKTESVNDEIFIILPKMKVDGKFSLTHPLLQQGISTMFNPSTANFTDMVHEDSGLYVSKVYHSVHFEMNEEGTIASAATAAIMSKSTKFIFKATRPFIFVITDENNLILFMGVISDPK